MGKKYKVLVIGSGLSAYGACLSLIKKKSLEINVIDIGLEKPYIKQPNKYVPNAKDLNGSFFAYGLNDRRWNVKTDSKRICSSHAFGGFSKVYSGSILKPKIEDLINWPKKSIPKQKDYAEILKSLEIEQKYDELNEAFPIDPFKQACNIPFNCYLGESRIATSTINDSKKNTIKIPFDSSRIFKEWIRQEKIKYFPNSFVLKLSNEGNAIIAEIQHMGKVRHEKYNFVYVGAGCINSTAIIDRSLFDEGIRTYQINSATGFLHAYLKLAIPNIKKKNSKNFSNYELCEYFMEQKSDKKFKFWSHTQIGPVNRIIFKKIKDKLPFLYPFFSFIGKFISFSNTTFHSYYGPKPILISKISSSRRKYSQKISILEKEYTCPNYLYHSSKIGIMSKFLKLRLIPIPFSTILGNLLNGNKFGGWHFGSTLPMVTSPHKKTQCFPSGEVYGLKNIYVIDSSTFPSIPGSTVALLTMANAYRIANESIKDKF